MVTPTCPKCKRAIPGEDVNVANDVAYCRPCNLSHPLSSLTHGGIDADVNLNQPPAGAWQTSDGLEITIGATHRSLGMAVGALFFGLFWNGILSVFLLLVTSATLRHLGITLPDWFPAPDMNDNSMSVGMTIFLWIFLTPFILVGLAMIGAFLSAIAGRTEVRIGNTEAVVFTGIGAFGYRRRFVPSEAKAVRIENRQWRDSDGDRRNKTCIVIETRDGKLIRFGSMVTEPRRKFIAAALQQALPA